MAMSRMSVLSSFLIACSFAAGCGDNNQQNSCDAGDGGCTEGPAGTVPVKTPPRTLSVDYNRAHRLNAQGAVELRELTPPDWERLSPKQPIMSFAAGDEHGCGIHEDGTLECFGYGQSIGFCSDSFASDKCGQAIAPEGKFIDIGVGYRFSCGIKEGGTIACWGGYPKDSGQAKPPASTGRFVQIAVANGGSCALDDGGRVVCWGAGLPPGPSPVQGNARRIALGQHAACTLDKAGVVSCWGKADSPLVTGAPSTRLSALSMHYEHACGIDGDGGLLCWGDADALRIPPPIGQFVEVAVGLVASCARRTDGQVECWGDRGWGSGSGKEVCAAGTTQLTGLSGSAAPQTYTAREDSTPYKAAWDFSYHIGQYGWMVLRGTTPLDSVAVSRGPRYALADGQTVDVTEAILQLEATTESAGPIYAAGAGSTLNRAGDENNVVLKNVGLLGSCPGTPVEGEVTICFGGKACAPKGTLNGLPWTEEQGGGSEGSGNLVQMGRVLHFMTDQVEHDQKEGKLRWGLVFTTPDGPHQGAVYCIGATSTWKGENFNDLVYVLRDFSRLGRAADVTGDNQVQGCIR